MAQTIQKHPRQDLGVNGRLPRHQDLVSLPTRPVEGIEDLREKPNRMILGDAIPQRLGEQKNLIPWQGGLVPSTHAIRLHTTASITNRCRSIAPRFEIDIKTRAN